jgi:hypothetical protein
VGIKVSKANTTRIKRIMTSFPINSLMAATQTLAKEAIKLD